VSESARSPVWVWRVSVSAAAASTWRRGGFWRETRAAAPQNPKIPLFPSPRPRALAPGLSLSPGFRCRDGPRRGTVLVVYGNKLLECHDAFLYYQFIMICGCESDPVSPDFELGLVPIPFFCPWIIRILLPILCSLDLFARQPRGRVDFGVN
jgi:hypothetical protein